MDQDRIRALRFWEALDAWATAQEPEVTAALRAAIAKLRASVTDAELADIIQRGDVEGLIQRLDLNDVRHALRDVAVRAAEQTPAGFATISGPSAGAAMGTWPVGIVRIRFDVLNPHAIDALRTFESRAVQAIEADVRAGFINLLQIGLERGQNPVATARMARGMLGLPQNLVRAIDRYRAALENGGKRDLLDTLERALRDKRFDRSVIEAAENAVGLDPAKIDRMVERMTERAIRFNAETLSRTGTMDALNVGNRLAFEQAMVNGQVSEDDIRRFWGVAKDERTCERCRTIPQLNPDGRRWNEPFSTPYDGYVMDPTLHFRCRCITYYKFMN